MNGFGHLPSKSDQNTFVFYANASGSASGSFQAWNVPEHAAFLHFTVIGGGGGGGGGGALAGASRKGAGGGAPGGIVAVSIPAILLPKTLYLQVGYGGAAGARATVVAGNGGNGGNGEISYVCLYPEINPGSVLIQSSETVAGGGNGATTTGTSVPPGTAITIANTNNLKWLGIVGNTVAQTAGGIGSTSAPGSVTYAGLLTGGAGGAGNGVAGGSIVMTNINSYVTTNITGGDTAGNPGSNGFFSWKPFIATGGAGGGATANPSVWGGSGGNGAYGCGGGGSGTCTNNVSLPTLGTGGYGGKGGDGLIIISVS